MIHIQGITYADSVRALTLDNAKKQGFAIGCIGVRSYVNGIIINMNEGNEVINLQIGNYCSLGRNIGLYFNRNHDYKAVSTSAWLPIRDDFRRKGQILVGNDVWIGDNATLLASIKIGDGAVIGSGAVVTKDVPPYAVVTGNPGTVHRHRFSRQQIQKLMSIKWWNWPLKEVDQARGLFKENIDSFIDRFFKEPVPAPVPEFDCRKTAVLLYPDFDDPYPVWPQVLNEYLAAFDDSDGISLLLRVVQDADFSKKASLIRSSLPKSDTLPDIIVVNDPLENEAGLIERCTHFVATRNTDTVRLVGYCDDAGVKVLSGVDRSSFDRTILNE